ncbi:MAG: cyclase family protein [Planctomycetes bacterium]|nr:cyclase family protein [Planctomycetota bacterium]NBY01072.1 cyclase family protein [Planctomycetota bacterium]NDE00012.1 cyclase family protein [bacterium]
MPSLNYEKIIDLTHPINPAIPVWPGDPQVSLFPLNQLAKDGFKLGGFSMGEHSGTHIGVAAHFHDHETTLDNLLPDSLFKPCVVIDFAKECEANPDFELTLAHLQQWEKTNGKVQAGCLVLLHTGWSRYFSSEKYFGKDDSNSLHFPGFSLEVTRYLIVHRNIAGLGIDTAGIEPGKDSNFSCNKVLLHGQRIHLENLTNLDQLPAVGANVFIGALPIEGATGSPARVIALVP